MRLMPTDHTPSAPVFASAGRALVSLAVLTVPAIAWVSVTGNPFDDLAQALPPGQVLYRLSKLAGLYAVMLLWMQVMYGLLKGMRPAQALLPAWSERTHRRLGVSVLAAALLHFGCFVAAVSLRKQAVAWGLFVPDFSSGYYTGAVSLGWCALLVLLAVAAAGGLRRRLASVWLQVHRLALPALWAVMIHGLLIGTDTGTGLWQAVLVWCLVSSGVALVWRWWHVP